MAKQPSKQDELVAQRLAEMIQKDPQQLSNFMSPAQDVKQATPQQERELFWTRAPGADESRLRQAEMQKLYDMGADPSQMPDIVEARVMAKLFPTRLGIITAGARALSPKEQIRFAERMARLGPPESLAHQYADTTEDGSPEIP